MTCRCAISSRRRRTSERYSGWRCDGLVGIGVYTVKAVDLKSLKMIAERVRVGCRGEAQEQEPCRHLQFST
jgi:hypothetical protein